LTEKKIKKNCAKVLLIKKLAYLCKVNKAQNKNKTTMKQNQHFEMTAAFLMGASIILSIIYLATI
jgi:hypothetical protein